MDLEEADISSKDNEYDDEYDDGDDEYRPSTAIGSLQQLKSLKSLAIPPTILFGDVGRSKITHLIAPLIDILPSSLESLSILKCENSTDGMALSLCAHFDVLIQPDTRLTELRRISICWPVPDTVRLQNGTWCQVKIEEGRVLVEKVAW